MAGIYSDSFPDIGGAKYGKDYDSVFKFTGDFDEFAIYIGNGKWKPYDLGYINVFTDLAPINDAKSLKANMASIDNAVNGE